MIQPSDFSVVAELMDPIGHCLTPEVARRLAGLRATPRIQQKLDEFADKLSEGILSENESSMKPVCRLSTSSACSS